MARSEACGKLCFSLRSDAVLVLGASALRRVGRVLASSASPTVTWADGVCSALSTYKTSLKETGSTLKSGAVSTEGFEAMAEGVKEATKTFQDDLQQLDQPQTQAAQTVTQTLTDLSSALSKDAEAIRDSGADGLARAHVGREHDAARRAGSGEGRGRPD